MREIKFTPGPWKIETCLTGYGIDASQKGLPFDRICITRATSNQDFSNANLIAAAPDMYEALERANVFISNGIKLGYIKMPDLECADSAWETPEIIRKALAKARGEAG